MTITNSKKDLEAYNRQRRQTGYKNMLFHRYLVLRYSLALYFFSNLYWGISLFDQFPLWLLPMILGIFVIIALAEQVTNYGRQEGRLTWVRRFFRAELIVQCLLLSYLLFGGTVSVILPVLSDKPAGRWSLGLIVMIGMMISYFSLWKIKAISLNRDTYYHHIKSLEKYI